MPAACKHGKNADWCDACLVESFEAKVEKLQNIMRNDILSALDDCVALGMSVEAARDVIRTIVAKALAP